MILKVQVMKGAIFYATKYGSTEQYAMWMAERTGLPAFSIKNKSADPGNFDFLVLGAPVIYHKLYNHKWVKSNLSLLQSKPVILFSVSGAGPGVKLDKWMQESYPESFIRHIQHIALLGRQNPKELSFYDRMMLIIGSWLNPDPKASKEELEGFDFMDKSSIEPVLDLIGQFEVV